MSGSYEPHIVDMWRDNLKNTGLGATSMHLGVNVVVGEIESGGSESDSEWTRSGSGSSVRASGDFCVSIADSDTTSKDTPIDNHLLSSPHRPSSRRRQQHRPPRALHLPPIITDSPYSPSSSLASTFFRACLTARMLKFWPSTPVDLTPKAGPNGQERPNPFETHLSPPGLSASPVTSGTSTSTSSSSSVTTTADSDPRSQSPQHPLPLTPTGSTAPSYHHQLLNTPHHLLSPSISATTPTGLPNPPNANAPIPHQPNPAPLTPSASSATALPTTSLSLHAPVFNMQQPPPPKRSAGSAATTTTTTTATSSSTDNANPPPSAPVTRSLATPNGSLSATAPNVTQPSMLSTTSTSSGTSNGTGGASKGQIHVKLISARGLNVRSSRARPYVVVQFEQNEFVSRDPTDEADKEVKGVATNLSRNSSSTALSALGAISGRVAAPGAATNGHTSNGQTTPNGSNRSANHSPSSSASSGKSGLSAMFGTGRISVHNPVWKHEVSL